MSENVVFRYASSKNITFRGEIDSGISREDWAEMSQKEQDEAIEQVVWDELIEIYAVVDE